MKNILLITTVAIGAVAAEIVLRKIKRSKELKSKNYVYQQSI